MKKKEKERRKNTVLFNLGDAEEEDGSGGASPRNKDINVTETIPTTILPTINSIKDVNTDDAEARTHVKYSPNGHTVELLSPNK